MVEFVVKLACSDDVSHFLVATKGIQDTQGLIEVHQRHLCFEDFLYVLAFENLLQFLHAVLIGKVISCLLAVFLILLSYD